MSDKACQSSGSSRMLVRPRSATLSWFKATDGHGTPPMGEEKKSSRIIKSRLT